MKGFQNVLGMAIVLAAAGCTSARPMMAPSGSPGLKIWCEIPSQCYERAAKQCPYGYNIEANEKDYHGFGDFDGNLFITCKAPGQSVAQAPAPPSVQPQMQTPANGSTPPAQQGGAWWNNQKPAAPAQTRYRCTDADGKPYVVTTPAPGCVVE